MRLYAKTKKGAGARTCVAYLLALATQVEMGYKENVDVSQWGGMTLGRWRKMSAGTISWVCEEGSGYGVRRSMS